MQDHLRYHFRVNSLLKLCGACIVLFNLTISILGTIGREISIGFMTQQNPGAITLHAGEKGNLFFFFTLLK